MSETREAAYERAAHLYADALRTGGGALKAIGTAGYHLRPSPQDFHRNVLAVAEFLIAADPVPPGPCWHDSGITWPTGFAPRCELLAGHAGAHTATRPNGGEAVWTKTTPAPTPAPTPTSAAAVAESESGDV